MLLVSRKHLIVGAIFVATFAGLFAGCSRQKSPSETAKLFLTAFAEENASEVKKYASSKLWSEIIKAENIEIFMREASEELKAEYGGIEKIEILGEEIHGERASVELKLFGKNGKTEKDDFDLIKEEGVWKVTK